MKIEAKNLAKKFGPKKAVEDISLQILPGQVLGLLGPNGAGKTTTIKMLTGQIPPTKGEIVTDGQSHKSVPHDIRNQLGIVPQEVIIWDSLNIIENLRFSGSLYQLPRDFTEKRIKFLMDTLHLHKEAKTLARNLSGGYQRRLNLAISLVHDPKVIFLDEPTPGIDVQSRQFLHNFILNLKKSGKYAIVLTDHYLDEAEKLSDYITIIDNGSVVAEGNMTSLKKQFGNGNILNLEFEESVSATTLSKTAKIFGKVFSHPINLKEHGLTTLVQNPQQALEQTLQISQKHNLITTNISIKEPSLEDIFLLITGHEVRE